MIGKTLGKYRIVEQLGRGGMATVFRAYHSALDRDVAIKLMHPFLADEEGFRERFRREAQSVARLRHPNIVQMYDFEAEGETTYMVMEFIKGPSLKQKLAGLEEQGQWLPLEEAARIISKVGEALDYAHGHSMVHRDVKPANIMLTEAGDPVLTDFGIVKMLSGATQITASGVLIGTPAYMSPEQSQGSVGDERADIYSLGIVLYQLATGRLPFNADTPMGIMLKHISAALPIPRTLNPDLPEGVERVILKALAKAPDDRYQSVREMLTDLGKAMSGEAIPEVDPSITMASRPVMGTPMLTGADLSAPIPAIGTRVGRSIRRVPPVVYGLVGLALAAALLSVWILYGGGGEATPTAVATTAGAVAGATTATRAATPDASDTPAPTNTPDLTATLVRQAGLTAVAPTATGTRTPTPADTPQATDTPTPTRTPAPTHTPMPTSTPTPSNTPDLTATALAACVYDAALEQHISVYPWQYFAPGAYFEKTWRVSNTGDCWWPSGTVLAFISGNRMGAVDEAEVESVAPGETADIRVAMSAPGVDGSYGGTWQLQKPDGEPFGEEIAVQINVGPTPTPRPTSTPLPTDTPLASATPVGPPEMSIPSIRAGSCRYDAVAGVWGAVLEWSAWGGTGVYEFYIGDISPEFRLEGAYHAFSSQVSHAWPAQTFIVVSGGAEFRLYRSVQPSECGY